MIKVYDNKSTKYEKFEGIKNSYIAYTQPPESKIMGACLFQCADTGPWEHNYVYDEYYLVLDGEIRCTVAGKTYTASRGDIVFAEKGTETILECVGPTAMFCVTAPVITDDMIREAAGTKK